MLMSRLKFTSVMLVLVLLLVLMPSMLVQVDTCASV